MCDQYGRISDTHQANQDTVFEWIKFWFNQMPQCAISIADYPAYVLSPQANGYQPLKASDD